MTKSLAELSSGENPGSAIYNEITTELQGVYKRKIAPLETVYNFEMFNSPVLNAQDISTNPMVLLLGQYSTGKTTFIEYILGESYPGSYVGIEPTTDKFTAVMSGQEKKIIPGHAAAVSGELPFSSLQKFGTNFLSRFQVSQMDNPLLKNLTIVDTPGILSGSKQMQRGYDFSKAMAWFGTRADLILILFDGHKLDISDEFKEVIQTLKPNIEKVRIVLNKCDTVDQQQLMRVYGALMWSLGKVIDTPEVPRVYLGSFWPATRPPVGNKFTDSVSLIEKEQKDLLQALKEIPVTSALRKVNDMVKRARQAKVHAYIIGHLKNEMPTMFGKNKKAKNLIFSLRDIFITIQNKHGLSPGDFPVVDDYQKILYGCDLSLFKRLDTKYIEAADNALSNDFSKLMNKFPARFMGGGNYDSDLSRRVTRSQPPPYSALVENSIGAPSSSNNPFGDIPPMIDPNNPASLRFLERFNKNADTQSKLIGGKIASSMMEESGLEKQILREIWKLADWDSRGSLDTVQFEVAMRLCSLVSSGVQISDAEDIVFRDLGLR
ncbi:hypothetical protein BB560_003797 [Smittium megazygosporum]|uniref:EH domain-containing protein n=1 Tax=Smittium megazygosporum TaxID=133381 RepID=A0A2T9ZB22_9FUNG|nr:hypothetical protein BB560_003797 [Smittium megazygosporum]